MRLAHSLVSQSFLYAVQRKMRRSYANHLNKVFLSLKPLEDQEVKSWKRNFTCGCRIHKLRVQYSVSISGLLLKEKARDLGKKISNKEGKHPNTKLYCNQGRVWIVFKHHYVLQNVKMTDEAASAKIFIVMDFIHKST